MFSRMICLFILVLMTTGALTEEGINKKESYEEKISNNRDNSYRRGEINYWSHERKTSLKQGKNRYSPFIVNPPPPEDGAKMARYIVHSSEWASLGSISSMPAIKGFPFADVYSISDGPLKNSSGVPYLYMTPLDLSARNIEKDNRCSLSLTLAQSNYCKQKHFDPEDPRCAHVVLTGKIEKVKTGTADEIFARNALFSRHPAMKTWPKDHHWFFAKLQIKNVCLLDYFGGPKYIDIDEYFHAKI